MLFSLTTPLGQVESCVRSRVAEDARVDERGVRVWFKGWEDRWGEDSMVMSRGESWGEGGKRRGEAKGVLLFFSLPMMEITRNDFRYDMRRAFRRHAQ
jgi:hypothetical protein